MRGIHTVIKNDSVIGTCAADPRFGDEAGTGHDAGYGALLFSLRMAGRQELHPNMPFMGSGQRFPARPPQEHRTRSPENAFPRNAYLFRLHLPRTTAAERRPGTGNGNTAQRISSFS